MHGNSFVSPWLNHHHDQHHDHEYDHTHDHDQHHDHDHECDRYHDHLQLMGNGLSGRPGKLAPKRVVAVPGHGFDFATILPHNTAGRTAKAGAKTWSLATKTHAPVRIFF